jgi:hypothetical protein
MKSFSRAVAALLAATAVVVSPESSSAEAKLAPTLSITASDPNTPVEVPPPTPDDPYGAVIYYHVDVAGGPATNVTVSVTGAGLNIVYFAGVGQTTPGPVNLGTVSGDAVNYVAVTAATGGFHQLTFTVTADGAAPATTTLNYVWAPTGAMTVSPGADLQGTYFGVSGDYSENDTSFEDRSMLLFLTPDVAYYGVPTAGLPTCRNGSATATTGCLTYAYDPTSHLIQIGGSIGTVDTSGVHTVGLGVADEQNGDLYAQRDWTQQLQFPNKHHRYAGRWGWVDESFYGYYFVSLTLRKDGTFVLSEKLRKKRTIKGHYDVSHGGRMRLTGKFGTEVHTFAVFLNKKGRPDPRHGVALSYGKGKNGGVFFLEPKKK